MQVFSSAPARRHETFQGPYCKPAGWLTQRGCGTVHEERSDTSRLPRFLSKCSSQWGRQHCVCSQRLAISVTTVCSPGAARRGCFPCLAAMCAPCSTLHSYPCASTLIMRTPPKPCGKTWSSGSTLTFRYRTLPAPLDNAVTPGPPPGSCCSRLRSCLRVARVNPIWRVEAELLVLALAACPRAAALRAFELLLRVEGEVPGAAPASLVLGSGGSGGGASSTTELPRFAGSIMMRVWSGSSPAPMGKMTTRSATSGCASYMRRCWRPPPAEHLWDRRPLGVVEFAEALARATLENGLG